MSSSGTLMFGMQPQKRKQSSRGLSCLTCRKRRKKCDRSRPACERCIKGGFQCLGYDRGEGEAEDSTSMALGSHKVSSERGGSSRANPIPILPKPVESISYTRRQPQLAVRDNKNAPYGISLSTPGFEFLYGSSRFRAESVSPCQGPVHSTPQAALVGYVDNKLGTALTLGLDSTTPLCPVEGRVDNPRPENQPQSLARLANSLQLAPAVRNPARRSPETSNAINELGLVVRILYMNIPRSVNGNTSMRRSYVTFTIRQYGILRSCMFLQPPPISLLDMIATRIKRSGETLWIFYLAAKILEQLKRSSRNPFVRPFVHWINKCDQQLTETLDPNCSVEELENRLMCLVELTFLKFVTIDIRAGYSLLKRSLPVFLALVSTDPGLRVEHQELYISAARALGGSWLEVRRFVCYDIMTGFALGVPQLVKYDTSGFFDIPAIVAPIELAHGFSLELAMIIVQINAWRTSNPGIPNVNDWPDFELRALAWIPRATQFADEDSYDFIVRSAIQESWRQAVLIYIYMGMCCIGSQDPRIQRSVRQIIRLMDIVSGSAPEVHLLFPSLTAGIAARYEQQRVTVRKTLSAFHGTRAWLLPGAEFATVLDHLWHGVAAGGAPVTWDDYVCSRRAVLPGT